MTDCGIFKEETKDEPSVDDGTSGMLIVLLLFTLPSKPNFWPTNKISYFKKENRDSKSQEALITWRVIHDRMPWGLVFLLGGGFALSKASKISGLSHWMAEQLSSLDGYPPWVIVTIICIVTAMATELTSNVATASILMPILKNLVRKRFPTNQKYDWLGFRDALFTINYCTRKVHGK